MIPLTFETHYSSSKELWKLNQWFLGGFTESMRMEAKNTIFSFREEMVKNDYMLVSISFSDGTRQILSVDINTFLRDIR